MKNTPMLNKFLYPLSLLSVLIIVSCSSSTSEQKLDEEHEGVTYNLDKFNDLSTFFTLDSIKQHDRSITAYFTDTSKFYQPGRHAQFYTLLFLTTLNTEVLKTEIDAVTFDVSMIYREEGDIVQTFPSDQLLSINEPYNLPKVKTKIIQLNKYNKQEYLSWTNDENIDVLLKLNMYFGQISDPTSWIGVDSYRIIWEYENNRARGHDLRGHLDAFNNILTDTLYMKEREIGSEVHRILID